MLYGEMAFTSIEQIFFSKSLPTNINSQPTFVSKCRYFRRKKLQRIHISDLKLGGSQDVF